MKSGSSIFFVQNSLCIFLSWLFENDFICFAALRKLFFIFFYSVTKNLFCATLLFLTLGGEEVSRPLANWLFGLNPNVPWNIDNILILLTCMHLKMYAALPDLRCFGGY